VLAQPGRILRRRERMVVSDGTKQPLTLGKTKRRPHRAQIVSEMGPVGLMPVKKVFTFAARLGPGRQRREIVLHEVADG
jgi:hypothetical protein